VLAVWLSLQPTGAQLSAPAVLPEQKT